MTDDLPMSSHFAPPEVVAHDIVSALYRGAPDVLYTPWFWKPIMIILRHTPEGILKRISF